MTTAIELREPRDLDVLSRGVPENWCENTLAPWADEQTDPRNLSDAHLQVSTVTEAYRRMGRELLELTKARRYLELRVGEFLLGAKWSPKAERPEFPGMDEVVCRKMARNKQLIVDMIESATKADLLSVSAVLRAIKKADPKYRKEREVANKRQKERRDSLMRQVSKAEVVLERETARKAAKRRGDHTGKAWSLVEHLLIEVDHAIDESEVWGEREQLLRSARSALHDAWDLLGQAVRIP